MYFMRVALGNVLDHGNVVFGKLMYCLPQTAQ